MTSQVLISKIHCILSTNQKRDSELNVYNNYYYFTLFLLTKNAPKADETQVQLELVF